MIEWSISKIRGGHSSSWQQDEGKLLANGFEVLSLEGMLKKAPLRADQELRSAKPRKNGVGLPKNSLDAKLPNESL